MAEAAKQITPEPPPGTADDDARARAEYARIDRLDRLYQAALALELAIEGAQKPGIDAVGVGHFGQAIKLQADVVSNLAREALEAEAEKLPTHGSAFVD